MKCCAYNMLKIAGLYLVADGVASIIVFRYQPLKYQIWRGVRAAIGIALLAISPK